MSVKRYFFNAGEANVWREENEAGDCVDYTDYASLLERCEKMEKALTEISGAQDYEPVCGGSIGDHWTATVAKEALASKEEPHAL